MNLQSAYDLSKAEAEKGKEIKSRIRPRETA
jgi:plasmid maintenance system antidote protein VapI